jgi:hypothetical protein
MCIITKQKVTLLYWFNLNNPSPLIFNYSVRGSRSATSAIGNFAKSRSAAFVAKFAKA